ncbi:MAG TPA: XRE family transcriptional regulator [Spirochaetia bacterium]|nr:XRE family transcriptional regulator [Spirochaetia bacterium]
MDILNERPGEEKIIARRIHKIRLERELTLEDVAGRTGLTKGLLSKIENNRVSPPIATLVRIARALEVSLADFFSPGDERAIQLVRAGRGVRYNPEGAGEAPVTEALVSGFARPKMEPLVVTIDGTDSYQARFYSHPGQELILVLEGKMDYRYAAEEYHLFQGDSLYFNAEHEHGPLPLCGKRVKYLSVLCP